MSNHQQTLIIFCFVLFLTLFYCNAQQQTNSTSFLDKLVNEVKNGRKDMMTGGVAGCVVGAATAGPVGSVIGAATGAVGNAISGHVERVLNGRWGD